MLVSIGFLRWNSLPVPHWANTSAEPDPRWNCEEIFDHCWLHSNQYFSPCLTSFLQKEEHVCVYKWRVSHRVGLQPWLDVSWQAMRLNISFVWAYCIVSYTEMFLSNYCPTQWWNVFRHFLKFFTQAPFWGTFLSIFFPCYFTTSQKEIFNFLFHYICLFENISDFAD